MRFFTIMIAFLVSLGMQAKDLTLRVKDSADRPVSFMQIYHNRIAYVTDQDGIVNIPAPDAAGSIELRKKQVGPRDSLAVLTRVTWNGTAEAVDIQLEDKYSALLFRNTPPGYLDFVIEDPDITNRLVSFYFTDNPDDRTKITGKVAQDACYYNPELGGVVAPFWNNENETVYLCANQELSPTPIVRNQERNLYEFDLFPNHCLIRLSLVDFDANSLDFTVSSPAIAFDDDDYGMILPRNSSLETEVKNSDQGVSFTTQIEAPDQTYASLPIKLSDYYNRLTVTMKGKDGHAVNDWICNSEGTVNGKFVTYVDRRYNRFSCSLQLDGYMPWMENIQIDRNDMAYEIDLKDSYQVNHQLLHEEGTPLANQTVRVENAGDFTTDENGFISFFVNEPSVYYHVYSETGLADVHISSSNGNPVQVVSTLAKEEQNYRIKVLTDYDMSEENTESVNGYCSLYEEQANGFLKLVRNWQFLGSSPDFKRSTLNPEKKYWILSFNQNIYSQTVSTSVRAAAAMWVLNLDDAQPDGDRLIIELENKMADYRRLTVNYDRERYSSCVVALSYGPGQGFYIGSETFLADSDIYLSSLNYRIDKITLRDSYTGTVFEVPLPIQETGTEDDVVIDLSDFNPSGNATATILVKNENGDPLQGVTCVLGAVTQETSQSGTATFEFLNTGTDTINIYRPGFDALREEHVLEIKEGANHFEFEIPGYYNSTLEFADRNQYYNYSFYNAMSQNLMLGYNYLFQDSEKISFIMTPMNENRKVYAGYLSPAYQDTVHFEISDYEFKKFYCDEDVAFNFKGLRFPYPQIVHKGDSLYLTPGVYSWYDNDLYMEIKADGKVERISDFIKRNFIKIHFDSDDITSININGKSYSEYLYLDPGTYEYTVSFYTSNTNGQHKAGVLEIQEDTRDVYIQTPDRYITYFNFVDETTGEPLQENLNRFETAALKLIDKASGEVTYVNSLTPVNAVQMFGGNYHVQLFSEKFYTQPFDITVNSDRQLVNIPVKAGDYNNASILIFDSEGNSIAGAKAEIESLGTFIFELDGGLYLSGLQYVDSEIKVTITADGYLPLEKTFRQSDLLMSGITILVMEKDDTAIDEMETAGDSLSISLKDRTLQVEGPDTAPLQCTVYDLQGRMVLNRLHTGSRNIRLDSLQPGMYLVRCVQGNRSATLKFILE